MLLVLFIVVAAADVILRCKRCFHLYSYILLSLLLSLLALDQFIIVICCIVIVIIVVIMIVIMILIITYHCYACN